MSSISLGIVSPQSDLESIVTIRSLHIWFGKAHIIKNIHTHFLSKQINGIVGPSGSGKSTLIRSINRMNDEVTGHVREGAVYVNNRDIYTADQNVVSLRTEVGMVFQKPSIFPMSIADNVLFGIRHHRKLSKHEQLQTVEDNLKAVSLWHEVRHRLDDRAGSLSIGQQQRLCIARTLAVKPSVILLDEPTSSLDPVSARAIEDLMVELKQNYTIILVTHNIQQANRIADQLTFLCDGQLIEQGSKERLFSNPQNEQTQKYLNEEFCDCD